MRRRGFQPGYDPHRWSQAFTDRNRRIDAPAAHLGITPAAYEALVAAGLKWCTGCRAWQPRADFSNDRSRRDGLDPLCRRSKSSYQRAWRRRKLVAA